MLRPWRLCVRLETVTAILRPVSGGKWSFQSGPKIVFSKKERKKDHDIKLNVT